jgi:hypothetical protein
MNAHPTGSLPQRPDVLPGQPILDRSVAIYMRVGVGWFGGGGRLVVEPGKITLRPSKWTQALTASGELVHTDREVVVVRSRLVPPWMSCHLVMRSHAGAVSAGMPLFVHRKLKSALEKAGFHVVDRWSWFSFGHAFVKSDPVSQGPEPKTRPPAMSGRMQIALFFLAGLTAVLGAALAAAFAKEPPAGDAVAFWVVAGATMGLALGVLLGSMLARGIASGAGIRSFRWLQLLTIPVFITYVALQMADLTWIDTAWSALGGAYFSSGIISFVVVYQKRVKDER